MRIIKTESTIVARDLGGMGSYCVMGTVSVLKMKRIMGMVGGAGCTRV